MIRIQQVARYMGIIGVVGVLLHVVAARAFVSDITDAISGHIQDFQARSQPDEILEGARVVKEGSFRTDDPGQDALHYGSGDVTLVTLEGQYFIQMAPNVSIALAPDLFVYISTTPNIYQEARFNTTDQMELGMMVKGSGASWYMVPEGIDPKTIQSVTIWCKRFSEFMASADVQ